jgi:hypothetical protein
MCEIVLSRPSEIFRYNNSCAHRADRHLVHQNSYVFTSRSTLGTLTGRSYQAHHLMERHQPARWRCARVVRSHLHSRRLQAVPRVLHLVCAAAHSSIRRSWQKVQRITPICPGPCHHPLPGSKVPHPNPLFRKHPSPLSMPPTTNVQECLPRDPSLHCLAFPTLA